MMAAVAVTADDGHSSVHISKHDDHPVKVEIKDEHHHHHHIDYYVSFGYYVMPIFSNNRALYERTRPGKQFNIRPLIDRIAMLQFEGVGFTRHYSFSSGLV